MTSTGASQSSQTTEFTRRLTDAVDKRGLSLARIQAHLTQRGQSVSVATLSYWCSGRSTPGRASSLPVLAALEEILELPSGYLTSALRQPAAQQVAWSKERSFRLRQLTETMQLPTARGQELLMAHHEVVIGADLRQHESRTTLVTHARATDIVGWCSSVTVDEGQQVEVEALRGAVLAQRIDVDETAILCEFRYDPPLHLAETRRTQHRMRFTPGIDPSRIAGYAVARATHVLLLTLTFEGPIPRQMWRTLTPAAPDSATLTISEVEPRSEVELAVASPDLGLHSLSWEW